MGLLMTSEYVTLEIAIRNRTQELKNCGFSTMSINVLCETEPKKGLEVQVISWGNVEERAQEIKKEG